MNRTLAVAAAGAATVLVGAGAAFAGPDGSEQRGARCEALVAKIAEKRGVSVAELEARIKERLTARVEAALQAGRISADRAAMLEERIAEGHLCKGAQVRAKLGRSRAARGRSLVPGNEQGRASRRPSRNLARRARAEAGQERRRPRGRNARSRRGEAREGGGGETPHRGPGRRGCSSDSRSASTGSWRRTFPEKDS